MTLQYVSLMILLDMLNTLHLRLGYCSQLAQLSETCTSLTKMHFMFFPDLFIFFFTSFNAFIYFSLSQPPPACFRNIYF